MKLPGNLFFFRIKNTEQKYSITRILTITLTLAVVVSSIIAFSVLYTILSQKSYVHLERKADEFNNALKGTLEMPVWNLDYSNIEKIGQAFTHNDLFERLRIIDNTGNILFDFDRSTGASTVKRYGEVLHKGAVIGHFEMALTTKLYKRQNLQILYFGFGLMFFVIIILAIATGTAVRLFLKKLFHQTNMVANSYASGMHEPSENEMQYVEFQPLIHILRDLRDKLNSGMLEVHEAEKKYRGIFENAVEGIFQSSFDGVFISVNPAMAKMLGYISADDLINSVNNISKQLYVNPESRAEYIALLKENGEVLNFQTKLHTKSGETIWVSINSRLVYGNDGGISFIEGMVQDITSQKKAEEERERLEQQLTQSQKMESIGRLAGGIAHDYNNMLGVIIGYSDLLLMTLPKDDPSTEKIIEIYKAAQKSENLTRQLLAFARKQTVAPKVLDLNDTVSNMLKMLQRLLGGDIKLNWYPGDNLSPVMMDPGQIDQILVNLCINSKDAITGKGKISIETKNAVLDESFFKDHMEGKPGDFVMLSISDDGCGMNPDILEHIFEPFYTTKDSGKGTGLGLATVYGIIKQNNGIINVYSESGQGTVIHIYLPGYSGKPDAIHEVSREVVMGKGETVLLVEDEERLLSLGKQMLHDLGYTVIAIGEPLEALQIADENMNIDLLISDVIMPEMNGRELSEKLSQRYPDLKCLFMSGYTADVIAHQGIINEGIHFIQKPFSRKDLAVKIREILNS